MNIIVDYGLGNIDSVSRGFRKAGIETKISSDIDEINRQIHLYFQVLELLEIL
ncbi:hypothetical protein [Clostridioides difficile]|uniref:hypothetical protein n=1 Tax=Clostridioides difficile TaxID=1496 RepID=UPI002ED33281